MALGRLEVDQEPGTFISGARARWLLQAHRAQFTSAGKLRILYGTAHATRLAHAEGAEPEEPRVTWTAYSSSGAPNRSGRRWLRGYHMNGDAINRG